MKTVLTPLVRQTVWGQEADQILRNCVHCGFCTAVCPTYQLLGNELDGPRGRIYLIKSFLEGNPVSAETQRHLDLCLTCRACETACPSGVQYGRLADIGRGLLEDQVKRPLNQRLIRWGLRKMLPYPKRFRAILKLGQCLRPLLPQPVQTRIPKPVKSHKLVRAKYPRTMIVLEGCVQPSLAPDTNDAAEKVLGKLGITLLRITASGCCGAMDYHLGAHDAGLEKMRRLIDAWWTSIESGAEAIVITASGCGNLVKDYGHLLKEDSQYAEKAARISALTYDLSEIVAKEDLSQLSISTAHKLKIAVHEPCSLQHAQRQSGSLTALFNRLGFTTTVVPNAHLCCGSAGAYSLLNKTVSQQLLDNKLDALESDHPDVIVTANIGCQMHLASKAQVPVKHWITFIAEYL